MKYTLVSSLLAIAAVTATAANAQSGPNFQFSGEIGIEAVGSRGSTPFFLAFADIQADYRFTTLASGVDLGFEFSFDGFTEESLSLEVLHGGFYADFGAHRVTLGYPQGSFATYRGASVMDGSALVTSFGFYDPFAPSLDFFQLVADKYAPGIRYDGAFGAWSVSGSYNRLEAGGSTLYSVDAAVQYRFSDAITVWASAAQIADDSGFSDESYAAGVTGSINDFDYSVSYVDTALFGGELVEASLFYHVNDNLELGLGGIWEISGGGTQITSVSAEYGFADRYFVRGMITSTSGSSDPSGSLSVGIEF